jgi:hypothetical protein
MKDKDEDEETGVQQMKLSLGRAVSGKLPAGRENLKR